MLYDHRGQPIKPVAPNSAVRNGIRVDSSNLPSCAKINLDASITLSRKLRNDSRFRELVEKADKITGTRTMHLDMIAPRPDIGMTNKTTSILEKNQKFGEKVLCSQN